MADPDEEIQRVFASRQPLCAIPSFRQLCNCLKAGLIAQAVARLRDRRLRVVDAGAGRGGDLTKWTRYRLASYLGVDLCEEALLEARQRFSHMTCSGRAALRTAFARCDLRRDLLPLPDVSVDVVSAQFVLQFLCDTAGGLAHFLDEVRRVLVPGGLFIAVFPDGSRLADFFAGLGTEIGGPTHRLGHFTFAPRTAPETWTSFGARYHFQLPAGEPCNEYLVPTAELHAALAARDFAPVLTAPSLGAQRFFVDHCEALASTLLDGARVTEQDWTTLACFRVVVAEAPQSGSPGS